MVEPADVSPAEPVDYEFLFTYYIISVTPRSFPLGDTKVYFYVVTVRFKYLANFSAWMELLAQQVETSFVQRDGSDLCWAFRSKQDLQATLQSLEEESVVLFQGYDSAITLKEGLSQADEALGKLEFQWTPGLAKV